MDPHFGFMLESSLTRRSLKGPKTLKDPAGNLRFRAGFGPKAMPNQAPNILPTILGDFGVFRRRSDTFKLRDSSDETSARTAQIAQNTKQDPYWLELVRDRRSSRANSSSGLRF